MTAAPLTATRPLSRTTAHAVPGVAPVTTFVPVTAVVPPTTARSPFVTLQPASPSGGIPGDANDGADFYGLGAALVGIVLVIVLARMLLRDQRSPERQSRGER